MNSDQLASFAPGVSDAPRLAAALNAAMEKYSINTLRRQRYFLSQSYFETSSSKGGFTAWTENLFYTTPEQLVRVWPSRFSMVRGAKAYAPDYVRNPQKLANLVYAGRNGNGDTQSGDGYTFIGRGAFHLTFRSNYSKASQAIYGDQRLVTNPASVAEYEAGCMAAGWFWAINNLNALADRDSFTQATIVINGSDRTVNDRLPVLNKANRIFI